MCKNFLAFFVRTLTVVVLLTMNEELQLQTNLALEVETPLPKATQDRSTGSISEETSTPALSSQPSDSISINSNEVITLI